jgi:hypothetical protein
MTVPPISRKYLQAYANYRYTPQLFSALGFAFLGALV